MEKKYVCLECHKKVMIKEGDGAYYCPKCEVVFLREDY